MFKFIFKTIFVLLILIVAGLTGVYFYAGNIVKKAVENFVPTVTQTTANLGHLDISLFKGRVALSDLVIGNPKGYTTKESFSIKNITVTFQPESIFDKKIVINQILIDGTHVTAEADYKDGAIVSNLTDIKKNVDNFISKNTSTASTSATESSSTKAKVPNEKGKDVLIKDLHITNSGVTVAALSQQLEVFLPNIEQKNIGEKKEVTWEEAVVQILDLISDESIKATAKGVKELVAKNAQALKDQATEALENAKQGDVSGILDTVKGIF